MSKFTQKVGPLPAWAWGVMIGLLVVGAMYWMRSKSAATTATPAVVDAYPGISDTGVPISSGSSSSATSPSTGLETNGGWIANSLAYLIAGGAGPLKAQNALASYLDGQTLDAEQGALVDSAIAHNGPPPQGTSGTSTVAPTNHGSPIGFARQSGTTAVYALYPDNTREWLDSVQYAAMGRPAFTNYAATDPIWQRYRTTGIDAPPGFRAV